MSTVFLDPRILTVTGDGAPGGGRRATPEAAGLVRHLVEAGHRVVLVEEKPEASNDGSGTSDSVSGEAATVAGAVPAAERGWLVTADAAACHEARRRPGLRTVLVGPLEPGLGLAHRPADVEARDLADAVLTILTAEAMPDARI